VGGLQFVEDPDWRERGGHDLQHFVRHVAWYLPGRWRRWLVRTPHVVLIGGGVLGRCFLMPPGANVRLIYLAERVRYLSAEEAVYVICHELAHAWLGPGASEAETDAQVVAWGVELPAWRRG
jgi:hypothetical protein